MAAMFSLRRLHSVTSNTALSTTPLARQNTCQFTVNRSESTHEPCAISSVRATHLFQNSASAGIADRNFICPWLAAKARLNANKPGDTVHSYKNARIRPPTDLSLPIPGSSDAKCPRAVFTLEPLPPTQSNTPFRRGVWMIGDLGHQSDLFRRPERFAIPARGNESGGRWQRACRKATSHWDSRRAAAYSAYSLWSARCLAAHDISRTCEQAGSADFTHSGPIAIGPIACIGILTASCVSSGMSSGTAGPLHFISLVRQNCAASRRSCLGTARTRLYPTPDHREFRCEGTAGASDRRDARQADRCRQRSSDCGAHSASCGITAALTMWPLRQASVLQ